MLLTPAPGNPWPTVRTQNRSNSRQLKYTERIITKLVQYVNTPMLYMWSNFHDKIRQIEQVMVKKPTFGPSALGRAVAAVKSRGGAGTSMGFRTIRPHSRFQLIIENLSYTYVRITQRVYNAFQFCFFHFVWKST